VHLRRTRAFGKPRDKLLPGMVAKVPLIHIFLCKPRAVRFGQRFRPSAEQKATYGMPVRVVCRNNLR
jgi:hypothetical protein